MVLHISVMKYYQKEIPRGKALLLHFFLPQNPDEFLITNRHALITDLKVVLLGYKVLRLPRYEM